MEDSGGAGKNRGGSGTCWEVEPLDTPMTLITFGEGRRIPAMGAAGAKSAMIAPKVGRLELTRNGGVEIITNNVIETIQPGQRAANRNPGGGGFGNPFHRDAQKVVDDVRNGLVSLEGARLDYGVVITDRDTLQVDTAATAKLRAA
jgi:N-methylhydantoinase B